MTLYNLKTDGDNYRITKFTSDLDVESSYLTSLTECECPAGHRPTCRHRQMLPHMLANEMLDAPKFMDFDTKSVYVSAFADADAPSGEEEFFESSPTEIESPVEIETMITLPDNVTGTEIAEAFAALNPNFPRPEYTEGTEGPEITGVESPSGMPVVDETEITSVKPKAEPHPSINGPLKRRI